MTKYQFILFIFLAVITITCTKQVHYSKHRNNTTGYAQKNDSTFQLIGISTDPEFGYSIEKPISVGVMDINKGAENVEKYIRSLEGPNHQQIHFTRTKACCPFRTKNFTFKDSVSGKEFGGKLGMLEMYTGEYNSGKEMVSFVLYLNAYDESKQLLAPKGLTYK